MTGEVASSIEKTLSKGRWGVPRIPCMKSFVRVWSLALMLATILHGADPNPHPPQRAKLVDTLDIEPVWAGHPVGFSLLTHAPYQFVAYYDAKRQLTIARRKLDERQWSFTKLPDTTGWDSHNYLAMAVDDDGFLHLSGDMHASPLNYFRSTKPLDPSSFEAIKPMVGPAETKATYPTFLRGPNNELIFTYRTGSSGDGDQIYNIYDLKTQTWKRMSDKPLTDGEGKRNAYFNGPVRGPDGWFHLAWVWRESPDASSNHDLSYARSKDLMHWETAQGEALKLPIRMGKNITVDPVPEKGGLINGNTKIGFDNRNRVTISYHKYDAKKNLQPWIARLEDGKWKLYQPARWDKPVDFGGGGTLAFSVRVGAVIHEDDGKLTQSWGHPELGSGIWILDPKTLTSIGTLKRNPVPSEIGKIQGSFPGLKGKSAFDSGKSDKPGIRYMLRWETLGANRDHPREKPWPEPSMLRLHAITDIGSDDP